MRLLVLENPFATPSIPERMVWTASSIKLFRRCKRKFFWKYVFKLKPSYTDKNLLIGSAFHNLLGEWYKGTRASMAKLVGKYVESLHDALKSNIAYYDQEDIDKLTSAIDCFAGMMLAYEELYSKDRRNWKINHRSIEAEFKIDMGEFDYAGKVDLVANDFMVEHKTTSKISETYIDRLPLDTQIRGYIYGGLQGLNLKFNKVLYDVILKSKLRRKTNETVKDFTDRVAHAYASEPDKYFYREQLRFDKQDLEAFQWEVQQTHKEYEQIINQARRQEAALLMKHLGGPDFTDDSSFPSDPRAWTPNDQACTDWFRTCEYHKLCMTGLDRGTALTYRQGVKLHEELEDE